EHLPLSGDYPKIRAEYTYWRRACSECGTVADVTQMCGRDRACETMVQSTLACRFRRVPTQTRFWSFDVCQAFSCSYVVAPRRGLGNCRGRPRCRRWRARGHADLRGFDRPAARPAGRA